jgi:Short C-terminal domain
MSALPRRRHPFTTVVLPALMALAGALPGVAARAADGPMDHVLQGRARPGSVAGEERPQAWNIAEYSAVRLVPIEPGSAPNQHPQDLPMERIERWLSQARLQGGREALFTRDEVEAVAKGVAGALKVARADQDVILLSSARRSGPLTPMLSITARLFVADGALQMLVHDDRLNIVTPYRAQQRMPMLAFGSRASASQVTLQRDGPAGPRPDWLDWSLAVGDTGAPGAAPPKAVGGVTLEDRLRRLKSLHEQGLISDEDYAVKRRSLLDEL